jgi:hypothetical protein
MYRGSINKHRYGIIDSRIRVDYRIGDLVNLALQPHSNKAGTH